MDLYLNGHSFHFECENLCRLFFPYSPVNRIDFPIKENKNEPYAEIEIREKLTQNSNEKKKYLYTVLVKDKNNEVKLEETYDIADEYLLTSQVYRAFSEITGYTPKWGMLTGIHPVKVLKRFCEELGVDNGIKKYRENYFVSEEKTELATRILNQQKESVESLTKRDFSLYVGIPFCPSRCSYCSFVSEGTEHSDKLIEPYFELLLKEIEKVAEVVKELDLRLVSAYVGGGTPTTLSAQQLKKLCEKIYESFDMSACTELTVEAGRADTITVEKLRAMKASKVTRISINPQSLSDEVLKQIGRKHTADDVREAFRIAKAEGFESINADLIIGLPSDTLESFKNTLDEVIELGASNITVHSLAIKRSSKLNVEKDSLESHKDSELVTEMMNYSVKKLTESGFEPYYLYRQTRTAGNLENIGWAKNGDICRYNIYTMDESSTVIACGAGGVSKIKDPNSNDLFRIFNFKLPYEYIQRFDEIIERKDGVIKYYEQFR